MRIQVRGDETVEPLGVLLRPGNAGSNTAADHFTVLRDALRQLPGHKCGRRPGRNVGFQTAARTVPGQC